MLQVDKGQAKILVIMGVVIIGLIFFILFKDNVNFANKSSDIEITNSDTSDIDENRGESIEDGLGDESEKVSPENIKVYITGQVQNPGVIEVPFDCRLNEVVDMVGGFLADADLVKINLAIRVQDEGMYFIPKIGEDPPNISSSMIGGQNETGKVNINTADQGQLETLPRIGPVLARSIIDYREQNGSFKSESDIKNVSGIGEKTFEGLKDLIIVK